MGYSQSELAEDICTQGTISNIENAITLPSTYILKEIANKLNIDIVDLVFIDDDPIEKILGKVSKLTAIGEHEKAYYGVPSAYGKFVSIRITNSRNINV